MSGWPEQLINSWSEFTDFVQKLKPHWPNRDHLLFRGQPSSAWSLEPSLARELHIKKRQWHEIAVIERAMIDGFRQEAHRWLSQPVLPSLPHAVDWWALMQHYGAPTRLLDWSKSPYVGMYFAVEKDWDRPGSLWWFSGAAAENLMTRTFGKLYRDIRGDNDEPFFGEPLPMLLTFSLRRTVDRIGNQQSNFTICLDASADHVDILAPLADYGDGPHLGKLIIPAEAKREFLRELQLMSVTGKSMFPGLDGLGRSIGELTRLSLHYGAT